MLLPRVTAVYWWTQQASAGLFLFLLVRSRPTASSCTKTRSAAAASACSTCSSSPWRSSPSSSRKWRHRRHRRRRRLTRAATRPRTSVHFKLVNVTLASVWNLMYVASFAFTSRFLSINSQTLVKLIMIIINLCSLRHVLELISYVIYLFPYFFFNTKNVFLRIVDVKHNRLSNFDSCNVSAILYFGIYAFQNLNFKRFLWFFIS